MAASASPGFLSRLNPIALVRDLLSQREVLWQFTQRTFHVRHKGSVLGILWAVLNPLLMLGLYFIVFGWIFGGHFGVRADETKVDFALALLLGLTVFHFLSEIIAQSPSLIVASPNLVKKVVFPLQVLPVANLGASFFNFCISLSLVVLGQLIFGRGLTIAALWLPVIVFPVVLLGMGLGWFLAALGVFLRDINQITQFASLLLMYVSAVFYSSAKVQTIPALWDVLRFNPVLHAIELMRNVMLWHVPVNLLYLGYLYFTGVLACLLGYACFSSLRSSFSDVL
jgi:lipopolysaccharide transport system permease protein